MEGFEIQREYKYMDATTTHTVVRPRLGNVSMAGDDSWARLGIATKWSEEMRSDGEYGEYRGIIGMGGLVW